MTPDQHGYTRCPSCGLWFRSEHAPDTSACWAFRHQRAAHEIAADHPLAFHLPECPAPNDDLVDCGCFDKQLAAHAKRKAAR